MNEKTRKELLKIVKANYENIAKDFSESRAKPVWPELKNIVVDIFKNKTNTLSVLDAGCGNGRLLSILPTHQIDYLGADNCQALINIAKEKYPEQRFEVCDLLDLNSIKEVNFDLVFSIAVLHHIPSKKLRLDALKQLKNKVKPGGLLVITNWNLWQEKKYRRLAWKFFALKWLTKKHNMDFGDILFDWQGGGTKGSQRYYHAFRLKELAKLAKLADLKIIKLYKDNYNFYLIATK